MSQSEQDVERCFGTDGIRGKVGVEPITPDFLVKVGWAVGNALAHSKTRKVLIGKDTRVSGYMIESALEAGLSAAGADVHLIGPISTPAVAYLTRTFRADLGIVVSASHNPFDDNGVKFFSSEGYKVSDEFQKDVEYWLTQPLKTLPSAKLGKAWRVSDAYGRYIEFCKSSLPHNTNLSDLKIVLDCANGSTYHLAPQVFSELGAEIIATHIKPNGLNINEECGSEYPEIMRERVLAEKADLGIAFDGDGDRVIMVDHRGEILDGDELLYIITKSLLRSKHLAGGVIGTHMTNMGLEAALNDLGTHLYRVPVGDHHIIAELKQRQWLLGGEPSGHIIYLGVATTADGIITALQVLQAMYINQMNLHDVKKGMAKFPRCMINLPYEGERINLEDQKVVQSVKNIELKLGKNGRVLLRYSGTEPVIRIMVEGEDQQLVKNSAQELSETIEHL